MAGMSSAKEVLAVGPAAKASTPASAPSAATSGRSVSSTSAAPVLMPEHCTSVQPQSGVTVVFCEPQPEGFLAKALPTAPSLLTSVLALFLSFYAIRYNFGKDARSRRQSIQDEFWLRKVVSPVSIEPFVRLTSDLLVNLPDPGTPHEDCEVFARDRLAEFRALTVAFQALELLNGNLYKQVGSQLEAIEDRLAEYFGDLDALAKDNRAPVPSRPEAIADLSALRLAVLEPIKDHQATLGS